MRKNGESEVAADVITSDGSTAPTTPPNSAVVRREVHHAFVSVRRPAKATNKRDTLKVRLIRRIAK